MGAALALTSEYALGDYTFALTKGELWDNDIVAGVFAGLAVGSTAYLFGKSIMGTTQRMFNTFGNLLTGNEVRNIGWQLRPGLSFASTAIGLLIDVCALGPTYIIWGEFYGAQESIIKHEFFQNAMCASLFLLLFTSTLDTIDDIVASSIERGTEEEREILMINGEFQKLAAIVDSSSSTEFLEYLVDRDEQSKEELLNRIGISAGELNKFVSVFDLDTFI